MTQSSRNKYPLKVWGFTILTTPFAISLFPISNGIVLGGIELAFIMIIFGSLFSIPALILFWILFDYCIVDSNLKIAIKKLLLALSGILLICLTFLPLGLSFYSQKFSDYLLPLAYSVVLTFFAVLLKIPPTRKKDTAIQ